MADYERGKMDIEFQKAAYDAFWVWSTRVAVFCSVVLLLMWIFLT